MNDIVATLSPRKPFSILRQTMNEPSARTNPDAPDDVTSRDDDATSRFHPLWIWLAFAIVTSVFGTPADPLSMLLASVFLLGCFCVGAIVAGSSSFVLRIISAVACSVPAAFFVSMFDHPYFVVGAGVTGAISIAMGAWACRLIHRGRLRILACFSAGYLVGSLVGLLGTIGGAIMAAAIAQSSLRASTDDAQAALTCSK